MIAFARSVFAGAVFAGAVFARRGPALLAAAFLAAPWLAAAPAAAQSGRDSPSFGEGRSLPRFAAPPGGPQTGSSGPETSAPAKAAKPVPDTSATAAERLDALFERLAKAKDAAEANGIAGRIDRAFARSASETSNLLMARAVFSLHRDEATLAEDLLDRLLSLDPDWAEAWSRRGAVRLKRGDLTGAVVDFSETLKREPRHYGALSALGFAFLRMERKPEALRLFQRALAVHPYQEPTRSVAGKLEAELAGRDL